MNVISILSPNSQQESEKALFPQCIVLKSSRRTVSWLSIKFKVRGSGVKMTDLRPLPKPAPHGDILRFIYEKDGRMTRGEREEENSKTGQKIDLTREKQADRRREL